MSRGSLLYPGMKIPPGAAYCCACPWHVRDSATPGVEALSHHQATAHPVVASLAGAPRKR